jgi:hypothetical protein
VASILLVGLVELDLIEELVVLRFEEELVVLKLLELVHHHYLVRLKNEEL